MTARLKLTRPEPAERDVLSAVRVILHYHPAVSEVHRFNSGAHVVGEGKLRRFVRYHTVKGMSDLWAILTPEHGTRQAFIEVKRPSKANSATADQIAFLEAQKNRGHIAFVCWNPEQALCEFNRQLQEDN